MKITKVDVAVGLFTVGAAGSYIAWGLQGVLTFVVVVVGLFIWYLINPDAIHAAGTAVVSGVQADTLVPRGEERVPAKTVDHFGSARVTEMQMAALVAAAMGGFVYKKSTGSNSASETNNFHDRTISSLQERGLLDYAGGERYYLTSVGRSILTQAGVDLSAAWQPKPWATIRIEYRDSSGETTDRIVDVFDVDRYRIQACCQLRGGEMRTFYIKNVQRAADVTTGEQIDGLPEWLSERRKQLAS